MDRSLSKPGHNCAGGAAQRAFIVAITGGSGSGKTTLACRLQAHFGEDAAMISHDDYYKHLPDMTDAEAAVYDFDSPEALDTDILIEHLRTLAQGHAVEVPSYDFAAHARTERARLIEPVRVIIVEGMLLMCTPELLELFDLVVYADADCDVRLSRRIVRDCRERGASLERAVNMYLGTAKPAHEKYVEPFKHRADLIVPDAFNDRAVEVVARGIEGLLPAVGS